MGQLQADVFITALLFSLIRYTTHDVAVNLQLHAPTFHNGNLPGKAPYVNTVIMQIRLTAGRSIEENEFAIPDDFCLDRVRDWDLY
jgi:hypothetical protein